MSIVVRKRGPVREAIKNLRRWWRRWRADVHIVSFPKCGRTWLVLLIAQAIERHHGVRARNPLRIREYHSRRRGIPYMHAHHDGGPEFLRPDEITTDKSFYANRKVIFLVRDPRDVLVSSYFQKTKRNYNYVGALHDYVRERRGGIESIVRFYNVWAENRNIPRDFLLITYEDLHADTAGQLRRILDFIGLACIGDDAVRHAIDYCSFENMRRLEAGNALQTGALSPRDAKDQNTYKTRRGKVGGYTDYLSAEALAYVSDVVGGLAPFYEGYAPRTSANGHADAD